MYFFCFTNPLRKKFIPSVTRLLFLQTYMIPTTIVTYLEPFVAMTQIYNVVPNR